MLYALESNIFLMLDTFGENYSIFDLWFTFNPIIFFSANIFRYKSIQCLLRFTVIQISLKIEFSLDFFCSAIQSSQEILIHLIFFFFTNISHKPFFEIEISLTLRRRLRTESKTASEPPTAPYHAFIPSNKLQRIDG